MTDPLKPLSDLFRIGEIHRSRVLERMLDGENHAPMKVQKSSKLIFWQANIITDVNTFSSDLVFYASQNDFQA